MGVPISDELLDLVGQCVQNAVLGPSGADGITVIRRFATATAKYLTRDSRAAFADPMPTQGWRPPVRLPSA